MTTEQLPWDDERIISEAESIAAFWQQHETPRSLWRRDIVTLLKHMREQMTAAHETELAKLRGELAAARWEPITDGNYLDGVKPLDPQVGCWIYGEGERISLSTSKVEIFADLPDDVRLCRLVPPADAGGEVTP